MDSATSDSNGVIITGDLDRRPSRAPDYQAEAHALTALAEAMSTNPDTMLQRLVEVAMDLTRSDSTGISLLEPGGENDTFRWVATTGAWSLYRDGTMPREASPCGEVITREAVLLMKNPERSFPALLQAEPGIGEVLLAPFYLGGIPVGTVWTIKHSPDDHFEAEDARVLKSLACFASAAHQTVQALQLAKAAGQQAEIRVQQLVSLAELSNDFFGTCDMEYMPIYGNAAAMRMVGLADLDVVKRTPLQEFFFPEDLAFITDEFFPRVLREGQAKVEIRFRHFVTGAPVWVDYSLVVLRDEMGRATGLGTVTHDLTERKQTEAVLQANEHRFRTLIEATSAVTWSCAPSGLLVEFQPQWSAFTGQSVSEMLGEGYATAFHPDDAENAWARWADAVARDAPYHTELRIRRHDGEWRWMHVHCAPVVENGVIDEWFGMCIDITERKVAEEHAQLLMAEVNHRARNLLSVVQAVAQQTAKLGDPLTFAARLSDRIGGLAANQDLLVKNLWQGVAVGELVTSQLAHFKDLIGTRVHLHGPEVTITAAASQTIGMAMHELATNAAKYGALSNANGQVHVEWQLTAGLDSLFQMSWRESDGPQVKPPTRKGFGQTVIKRLVETSVDGAVKVDYAEDGFSWHLATAAGNVLVTSGGGGG